MLEPVVGAVCANLHQLSADGLGSMAAAGTVCPQLMDQFHDEENTIQPPHGIHAEIARVHVPITLTQSS
jgi:hypothetical protein